MCPFSDLIPNCLLLDKNPQWSPCFTAFWGGFYQLSEVPNSDSPTKTRSLIELPEENGSAVFSEFQIEMVEVLRKQGSVNWIEHMEFPWISWAIVTFQNLPFFRLLASLLSHMESSTLFRIAGIAGIADPVRFMNHQWHWCISAGLVSNIVNYDSSNDHCVFFPSISLMQISSVQIKVISQKGFPFN